jgi:hypothetical protein
MQDDQAKLLAFWINERYSILQKRRAGEPKPWTEDRIFRTVRFCNVHREDDKVTEWIRKNWRNDNWNSPNLTTAMVLARMVNNPATLYNIGFPHSWDPSSIKNILRGSPPPVFGNAYLITTCGKRMDKVDYVVDWVCSAVQEKKWNWDVGMFLKTAHAELMRIDGLGSFLSAQVIADLKNTPGHPFHKAPDWHSFSAHGPGSLKGLSYYHGTHISPHAYEWAIRKAYEEVKPLINPEIPPIHMQDFQNCLCEFSKYCRVRDGGRAKNGYPG